jgi:hypothetical protein
LNGQSANNGGDQQQDLLHGWFSFVRLVARNGPAEILAPRGLNLRTCS